MPAKRATPTLQDVATAAKVSTATVSRCLNAPDQVAKTTRDVVMDAVRTLGYSPNFGARAMAARRTNTIGAIIPTMENAVFARGLQAFQDELHHHGFTLLVASTSYSATIEAEQIRTLVARGADALLLIGHARDPDSYRFLEAQGVPALVTWAFDPEAPRPSVGFDNRAAMRDMADRVIALGHNRLALLSAHTESNDRAAARRDGICDAMAAAGLNPTALRQIETRYGFEEGATAFTQVMEGACPPTAVFCGNDVLAVGALLRARQMGLSVPGDVSVIGFDDIELAAVAHPGLTTVHVPHRDMGRAAALSLIRLIRDGEPLETVSLPTRSIMRETLGPPPA